MDVPPVSNPAWRNIVSGKASYEYEFLATKLILRHLTFQVKKQPSPDMIHRCAQELRNVFVRNASLACVQRDLIQMFGSDSLSSELYEVAEVKAMIARGKKLLLAGEETLLKQLPAGNWIGGSIPYFMTEQGGLSTQYKIYVTELPDFVTDIQIK